MLPQIAIKPSDLAGLQFQPVDGTPTLDELAILCGFVAHHRPQRLFEFGTFRGQTTLNLARCAPPDAHVFTLDLPPESIGALPYARDQGYVEVAKGEAFQGKTAGTKITQLLGDSATFDFTPYARSIDFIFVDACHSYEACMADSLSALAMIREGGVIFWHDYQPHWSGVMAALEDLQRSSKKCANLTHIAGTSLALLQ